MDITAHLQSYRLAPRKMRLVARLLKGRDALMAKSQLSAIPQKASHPISKLLDSAMANAYNNLGMVKENLFIKDVIVNGGRTLKRFRPKGFGSTSPIAKRTSNVTVILGERVAGLKADKKAGREKPQEIKPEATPSFAKTPEDKRAEKQEAKKEIGKRGGAFGGIKSLGRKFFRRKTI